MDKPVLTFIWQGISEDSVYKNWEDGLAVAIKLLEDEYEVEYKEPSDQFNGDILLYWEAPVTYRGKNSSYYKRVLQDDRPKALLFAGGPISSPWVDGFDLVFTESEINDKEFEAIGMPYIRAFGVNTEIFKPLDVEKQYEGAMQATFAGWKRHELFAETLGEEGLAIGRVQRHDRNGYNKCEELGVKIIEEKPRKEVNEIIQQAHCIVNTADYWGGGQRCTLEGMAAGLPAVVMKDSPKNREYIEESGCGVVCDPDPLSIRDAIKEAKKIDSKACRDYVLSKWTPEHYAANLKKGIEQLCQK